MIDEERIRRPFVDQVRAQSLEIARLQQVLNQRSANAAVEVIEGLGVLITLATAGDTASRQALGLLRDRLKSLESVGAGIVVVKG